MSCKPNFNTIYTTSYIKKCTNYPVFWRDSLGDSCDDYVAEQFCTPEGDYGPGWRNDWGSFEDSGSPSATTSCCACGGGIIYEKDVVDITCSCPEGSTLIDDICIPDDSNAIIVQTDTQLQEKCIDIEPTTYYFGLIDCNEYRDDLMCDPNTPDRKGPNWMDSYLLNNCCSCGGGNRTQIEVPVFSVICKDGFEMVDGSCICPEGTTQVDGKCLYPPKKCSNNKKYGYFVILVLILIFLVRSIKK